MGWNPLAVGGFPYGPLCIGLLKYYHILTQFLTVVQNDVAGSWA